MSNSSVVTTRAGWLVLAHLAGCGRLGFDAQLDAGAPSGDDAGDAAAACTGPFGPLAPIAELDSGMVDATLRLTSDELTGVMWSARSGNIDLYEVTRTARDQPFALAGHLRGELDRAIEACIADPRPWPRATLAP